MILSAGFCKTKARVFYYRDKILLNPNGRTNYNKPYFVRKLSNTVIPCRIFIIWQAVSHELRAISYVIRKILKNFKDIPNFFAKCRLYR
jgi:hypothetical protein